MLGFGLGQGLSSGLGVSLEHRHHVGDSIARVNDDSGHRALRVKDEHSLRGMRVKGQHSLRGRGERFGSSMRLGFRG